MRRLKKRIQNKSNNNTLNPPVKERELSLSLDENLALVKERMGDSMDLVVREFYTGDVRAGVTFLKGMAEKNFIDRHILDPLMISSRMASPGPFKDPGELFVYIKSSTLTAVEYSEKNTIGEILPFLSSGFTALFIDGIDICILINTIGFENRGVTEPAAEAVVRGPREGFTERLETNASQLRRKIKSPDLRLEKMQIGRISKTEVCIAYIKGIVNEKTVEELKIRLNRIDVDAILESGYIESFIEDAPMSVFATVGTTERPDVVAARMLEGRVAVLVDGTPVVLTVPYLFIETLQTSEDYYSRWLPGTALRWLRILAIIVTTQLPGLYVAVTTFNPEMLPTILFITIAASREGVPLPAVVEMIVLGIIFEILKEAGVRQPRPIGQAVSIVGALVIGEAAMRSGLVSAPAVMVVVFTGITSFAVPMQSLTYIYIRIFLVILASILGFFGFFLAIVIVLAHMVSLRSFGVPFLSPIAPTNYGYWKDLFLRAPQWMLTYRPGIISGNNQKRTSTGLKPGISTHSGRPGEKGDNDA